MSVKLRDAQPADFRDSTLDRINELISRINEVVSDFPEYYFYSHTSRFSADDGESMFNVDFLKGEIKVPDEVDVPPADVVSHITWEAIRGIDEVPPPVDETTDSADSADSADKLKTLPDIDDMSKVVHDFTSTTTGLELTYRWVEGILAKASRQTRVYLKGKRGSGDVPVKLVRFTAELDIGGRRRVIDSRSSVMGFDINDADIIDADIIDADITDNTDAPIISDFNDIPDVDLMLSTGSDVKVVDGLDKLEMTADLLAESIPKVVPVADIRTGTDAGRVSAPKKKLFAPPPDDSDDSDNDSGDKSPPKHGKVDANADSDSNAPKKVEGSRSKYVDKFGDELL